MPKLTERAHSVVRGVLAPGEIAIDATAGNGHDTRFLWECVGKGGRVFAFDLQPGALARTANCTAVRVTCARLLGELSDTFEMTEVDSLAEKAKVLLPAATTGETPVRVNEMHINL